MEWLAEQAPKLIIGLVSTVVLGCLLFLLRLSCMHVKRVSNDDLVQCQSREVGYQEAIEQRDKAIEARDKEIAFYVEQTTHREARLAELIKEIGERREAELLLERMSRPKTPRRSP